MRRPLLILTAILLLALPLIAACGNSDDDADEPTATEQTEATSDATEEATEAAETSEEADEGSDAELPKLKIGIIPVGIYGPVMLAQEKGYFEDAGIDSELAPLAGGGDMVTLTASGQFDIGIGGAGPAFFNAIDRGIDLKIISPLHFEEEPQATPLMVSKERYESGELDSVDDLEGKKVSVNARGATEYWLDQARSEEHTSELQSQ